VGSVISGVDDGMTDFGWLSAAAPEQQDDQEVTQAPGEPEETTPDLDEPAAPIDPEENASASASSSAERFGQLFSERFGVGTRRRDHRCTGGDYCVPEETTAQPEETTAVPKETTAPPEETTSAPEETTATPEETTAAPEETTALLEETAASSEETTAPLGGDHRCNRGGG
jgi:hypothetical protein